MLAGWGQKMGGYRFDTITTGYRVGCNWGSLDDTGHKQDKAHDKSCQTGKSDTSIFDLFPNPFHAQACH